MNLNIVSENIRNLIVVGCSFTAAPKDQGWGEFLSKHLSIDCFINLAFPGAGNYYIANCLIDYLTQCTFDPAQTLVIANWSGPTRKDILISRETHKLLKSSSTIYMQGNYYAFSGGYNGLWLESKLMQQLFANFYKYQSENQQYTETLHNMLRTRLFLEQNQYQYLFTSYTPFWHDDVFYAQESLSEPGEFITAMPLVKQVHDAQWYDRSIHTVAEELDDFEEDHFHPGVLAHQQYAKELFSFLVK